MPAFGSDQLTANDLDMVDPLPPRAITSSSARAPPSRSPQERIGDHSRSARDPATRSGQGLLRQRQQSRPEASLRRVGSDLRPLESALKGIRSRCETALRPPFASTAHVIARSRRDHPRFASGLAVDTAIPSRPVRSRQRIPGFPIGQVERNGGKTGRFRRIFLEFRRVASVDSTHLADTRRGD